MVVPVNVMINIQSVSLCHLVTALRKPDAENPLQYFKNVLNLPVETIYNKFAASDPHDIIPSAILFCCHAYVADALCRIGNRRVVKKNVLKELSVRL